MNSPVQPVLKELEDFALLGFDYMELTMDAPEAHYSRIDRERDSLMTALDRLGMGIACHLPTFVSTADLTEGLRKASLNEVIASLEVAAELKPLRIVLHPSRIGGLAGLVMDQAVQYSMDSLEAIVERADQLGLTLCLENMFPQNGLLVDPDEFVPIFKRFPNLKMTFDTGHAHIADNTGSKSIEFIEKFGDHIGHVHASDNFGAQDNHLPMGTGTIDFPAIVRALKGIKYNGTITLEVFSRDRDYLRISREKLALMFK